MSILAECPYCHKKQSVRNKVCGCGADLDQLKRSKKVKYWINYRLPNGKQIRQLVGTSIQEAKDADGKRKVQKREGRIFDMVPDAKITFLDLTEWYLKLERTMALSSFKSVKVYLGKFNRCLLYTSPSPRD